MMTVVPYVEHGTGSCGLQSVLCHAPLLLSALHCTCKLSAPVGPLFLVGQLLFLWQHFYDTLVCWYRLGYIGFCCSALFINALPFAIFCTRNGPTLSSLMALFLFIAMALVFYVYPKYLCGHFCRTKEK